MTRLVVRKPNHPALFNSPFETFFNEFFATPETPVARVKSRPAINVIETPDTYRLEVAAPGLNKEDFQLHVEDDVLTLKVEKDSWTKEDEKILREGFSYHTFERAFTLGDTIEVSGIEASYERGILAINLPKKEEAKAEPARTIHVQ